MGFLAKKPVDQSPELASAAEARVGAEGALENNYCTRTHETFVCSPSSLDAITGVHETRTTGMKWTSLFQKFLLVKAAKLT